jgi:Holliday junction resolvasome RuvABC DNA-binding subunit/5-methylcytosine-specific restriction endonuclease McrA
MDRLRVAKELGELPELEGELRSGALPYSAAKELSRVMTRETEAAWLARARGKNLRDIEELVSGHKKGDDPDAPKDPNLVARKRTFELPPQVDALLEQCRSVAADELGTHVDDALLVDMLCRHFLRGGAVASDKPPRPATRIVIHQCEDCGRASQVSRGREVELGDDALACAECDAEIVRETELGTQVKPTIPRRIRDKVWRRDRGRCRVPGCRATRNLDVHHIIHRAHGGDHDPSNLIVLCSGHHRLHHEGLFAISGRAPDELAFARDGSPLVDARSASELESSRAVREQSRAVREHSPKRNRLDDVVTMEHAKQALMQLGFKARPARRALEEVRAHVGGDADVATLVGAVLGMDRGGGKASDANDVSMLAKQALVQLGYPAGIAADAVEAACVHVGSDAVLETVIREALQRCA